MGFEFGFDLSLNTCELEQPRTFIAVGLIQPTHTGSFDSITEPIQNKAKLEKEAKNSHGFKGHADSSSKTSIRFTRVGSFIPTQSQSLCAAFYTGIQWPAPRSRDYPTSRSGGTGEPRVRSQWRRPLHRRRWWPDPQMARRCPWLDWFCFHHFCKVHNVRYFWWVTVNILNNNKNTHYVWIWISKVPMIYSWKWRLGDWIGRGQEEFWMREDPSVKVIVTRLTFHMIFFFFFL